jgi:hypothetical protein
MTEDLPRSRPFRTTGSALAVVLLPLVVGALASRAAGGDPMASVNALMTGGGQRARLSRSQLRTYRSRALSTARHVWDRSPGRADGQSLHSASAEAARRTERRRPRTPRRTARSTAARSTEHTSSG